MALIVLLAIDFPIGGFIGVSGWLPFSQDIDLLLQPESRDAIEDDHFTFGDDTAASESDQHENEPEDPAVDTLHYVRDLLSLDGFRNPTRVESALSTPVFLGHGDADKKVGLSLSFSARKTMVSIGLKVDWHTYSGYRHWYKVPDEIDDTVESVRLRVGWTLHNEHSA